VLGPLRRYYANLTIEQPYGWQDKRFADVGMHGAATSLAHDTRGQEMIEPGNYSKVDIACHAAAASNFETQEYPGHDRSTEKPLDFTTNELHIRMSLAAFALVAPILRDSHLRSASRPELVVILSGDVDSRLTLATRQLEVGQGQTFERITRGPFQPVRWLADSAETATE
jgi:hypothetical protein